jgi:hypothetical protein
MSQKCHAATIASNVREWGAFYIFIADFFAKQIIGGTKELVTLL